MKLAIPGQAAGLRLIRLGPRIHWVLLKLVTGTTTSPTKMSRSMIASSRQ